MAATLAELRTRAQRRADQENSSFVSDAEWNAYLNEGVAELHEIVVGKHEDFLVRSTTISLVANQNGYDLPSDFLYVKGLDLISGTRSYTIRPFMFRERNRFEWMTGAGASSNNFMYQIRGNQLWIEPDPASGDTMKLWYVPAAQTLELDDSSISTAYANGWERYVVLYAAIKALQKEESDVTSQFAELQMLQKRIENNAKRRSGDPSRVVDVRYIREDLT